MPAYSWSCLACGSINTPRSSICITCGCPESTSIRRALVHRNRFIGNGGIVHVNAGLLVGKTNGVVLIERAFKMANIWNRLKNEFRTTMDKWMICLALAYLLYAFVIIAALICKAGWIAEASPSSPRTFNLTRLGNWLIAVWAAAAPVFFYVETSFLRRDLLPTYWNLDNKARKAQAERLKTVQDVGSKVWLGIGAIIVFLVGRL